MQAVQFYRTLPQRLTSLPVLVLLSIASLTGCGHVPPPADPAVGRRVADAFLAQIRAGQLDAAWQSTTAEFKSDEGRESYNSEVKRRPSLRQTLNFVNNEVTDLNGLQRGQCLYESAPLAKSPSARVRVVVAQDAGQWRVDGLFVE